MKNGTLKEATKNMYGYSLDSFSPLYYERRMHRFKNRFGLQSTQELTDLLINNPDAAHAFKNEFNLSYTRLFREPSFFLKITRIIEKKIKKNGVVHIWHAGCAQGHEAYSLSIILEERNLSGKYKIYATDSNSKALSAAASGVIARGELQCAVKDYIASGGTEHLTDYFNVTAAHAILKQRILSKIKFAQHELGVHPPFQKFDLIICRNVLIYYNATYQEKLINYLKNALHPEGYIGFSNCETFYSAESQYNLKRTDCEHNIYQIKPVSLQSPK